MSAALISQTIAPATFAWVLASLSTEGGRSVDTLLLQQAYPQPHDIGSLQAAIRKIGMESVLLQTPAHDLAIGEGVCFAFVHAGSVTGAAERGAPLGQGDEISLLRIHRVSDEWIVVSGQQSEARVAISWKDFEARYLGHGLRVDRAFTDGMGSFEEDTSPAPFGFGWFASEMLRYRPVWRDVLFASLCIQVLALLVPLLTQVVIDKVMTHRTLSTLAVIACALLAATIFNMALGWMRQYFLIHAGTRIDAVLAADVFSHLLRLPPRYFEQRSTGVLVARMHGVETIRDFMTGAAVVLVLDVPFMFVFAALMLYYSPLLTAVAVGLLFVALMLNAAGTPLLRRRLDEQFVAGARWQAFLTERIAGIETVKSLQLEPVLERRFEILYGRYLQSAVRTRTLSATLSTGAGGAEQLLSLSVLCVGAWLVIGGGTLTVGALVAFQMLAARLSNPALRIVALWQEFQQVHVAVRRLADIMDVPKEPVRLGSPEGSVRAGRLGCEGLGFRYGEGPWLFRGLSFELAPGECAALIGGSGSGKSTFARLLQGFYLPSEGVLRLDGIDTRRMAANELRSGLGVVPQETRLFSGTVLENLIEAAPRSTFPEVMAACRAAGVHDVIAAMSQGYETRIGENGIGLSGGQKQRIAIARALLKGARLLVFDEATASLDPELARGVIETINGLRGKVSVLYIAHRLPEGLDCDRVIRFGLEGASS